MSEKIGVINEQGFVAGNGLGFSEMKQEDKEKVKDDLKDSTKNK